MNLYQKLDYSQPIQSVEIKSSHSCIFPVWRLIVNKQELDFWDRKTEHRDGLTKEELKEKLINLYPKLSKHLCHQIS